VIAVNVEPPLQLQSQPVPQQMKTPGRAIQPTHTSAIRKALSAAIQQQQQHSHSCDAFEEPGCSMICKLLVSTAEGSAVLVAGNADNAETTAGCRSSLGLEQQAGAAMIPARKQGEFSASSWSAAAERLQQGVCTGIGKPPFEVTVLVETNLKLSDSD
jgi:hypothetical protein